MKMLLIAGAAVLIVALAGGGAWFYVSQQRAALLDAGDEEIVTKVAPKDPPTYLPLDNLVVNLSDPGGEKVAQIGITLELADSAATEKVKQYLPTIRSSILILVSQRTSEELLQREGKEKLAADILREAVRPFGAAASARAPAKGIKEGVSSKPRPAKKDQEPDLQLVQRVLFSSFIVQ